MSHMTANYKLGDLAEIVNGEVYGDPEFQVTDAKPFDSAGFHEITLAANQKLLSDLDQTASGAVIVPRGTGGKNKNLLAADNPKAVFARILQLFHNQPFAASGISSHAVIGKNCRISEEVTIEPFVSIGDSVTINEQVTVASGCSIGSNCRIGQGCSLFPNVTLYPGVILGERVTIHSGTVIGADGFGYVRDGDEQVKLPQTGNVEIGDDVEIGANSCVDRAAFGSTVLEKNEKIDNHVHIGHNCRIGEGTIIVGSVGISGSVTIGKNCIFAGQSGASDHVTIGDNVIVLAKTAITKDVPSGMTVSGLYGRNHSKQIKTEAILNRLPDMYRDLKTIKKKLGL